MPFIKINGGSSVTLGGAVLLPGQEAEGWFHYDGPVFENSAWDGEKVVAALPPLEQMKQARAKQVAAIKVTTSAGNTFDGDEVSQGRMARAITAMVDADTTAWVLADSTVIEVSREELREALRLAGEAQTEIWIGIYA